MEDNNSARDFNIEDDLKNYKNKHKKFLTSNSIEENLPKKKSSKKSKKK